MFLRVVGCLSYVVGADEISTTPVMYKWYNFSVELNAK